MPLVVDKLSPKFLRQFRILPLDQQDGVLAVAMADPSDRDTLESLSMFTGLEIRVGLGREAEIDEALERLYGGSDEWTKTVQESGEVLDEAGGIAENIEQLRDMASEVPVIRMVNQMISRAVERRASDIHLEPFEKDFRVRYRIDGILYTMDSPSPKLKAAVISRLKLMAKLNIAERRLPQDGRIQLKVLGKEIDLRVSTLPTLYGESLVMRILDKSDASGFELKRLGFPDDILASMEKLTALPYGILLVTGPTGSGKSTTLYSAMKRINHPDKKIITIEDPVEYQMDGINQIHVNTQIGLTFAAGLRHIVRQGPRRDHGGGDPRPGDGRNRHPGGPHRPPGLQHPPHQRRPPAPSPAWWTWGGELPAGLLPGRGAGPAAGAHHLPALQVGLRRRCGPPALPGVPPQRRRRDHPLPGRGMRGLRVYRV